MLRSLYATFLLLLPLNAPAFELPRRSSQVVVGVTQSWESSHITVSLYEKRGRSWALVGGPWKGRCAKSGLA